MNQSTAENPESVSLTKTHDSDFQNSNTFGHLQALVGFDTQNPPRAITADSGIFKFLKSQLAGFEFELLDAGKGSFCLLAVRGKPEYLFNFHIDTVPIAKGWTSDPFTLKIESGKVYGLGACDIKGAAACMLTAVQQSDGDIALLFSTDEEHGKSDAIKMFLKSNYHFKQVIVAEPTQSKAVLAHRGICSVNAKFNGLSGHGSESRALSDSAIHKAAAWTKATVDWIADRDDHYDGLNGTPFNVGRIEGGIKANMIAADCQLSFGFRPLPGQSSDSIISELERISTQSQSQPIDSQIEQATVFTKSFEGPSLPSSNREFANALNDSQALASKLSLPIGRAVNFWTEASLFSEAGYTSLVFGPGDIAQAHTADEWVSIDQLKSVEAHYLKILETITSEKL